MKELAAAFMPDYVPRVHTCIIDLPTTCIHRLQQLVYFLVTHLFSEVCQNCRRKQIISTNPFPYLVPQV